MNVILFKNCLDENDKFRFSSLNISPNIGDVYNIIGVHFNGFASVIQYEEIGEIYESYGSLFIQQDECPSYEDVNIYQNAFNPNVSPGDAIQEFCVSPSYSILGTNVGNFSVASSLYDNYVYYTGETSGFIYFNTSLEQWCLSNTLGGSCLLTGKSPCYGELNPDLYDGIVFSGNCPTPTPSPASCDIVDFSAYFNCELSASTTPTPTITRTPTMTPSITMTPSSSGGLGINVVLSAYTYTYPSYTPSMTPSVTPTNNIIISGNVTYNVLDKSFSFSGVRGLKECSTSVSYYVYQDLIFSGVPVNIGEVIRAVVNGEQRCFEYTSNSSISSPNLYLDQILDVTGNCSSCLITPTPTPSPSITPTPTLTPSLTVTPTPSNNMVYVFQSCLPIGFNSNPTVIIQTQGYTSSISVGSVIKDSDDNCWSYLGAYSNTYVPSGGVIPITYSGNYFQTASTIYGSCQQCLAS